MSFRSSRLTVATERPKEIQRHLRVGQCLPIETGTEATLLTSAEANPIAETVGNDSLPAIPRAAACAGARPGARPGHSRLRILRLGKVDQVR